jgi:gliding motility-associated-like protein
LYTAILTDINGCTIKDSILITVTKKEKVFVPSAFSPNNDGINDYFTLFPGPEIVEIQSFRIFDRWGKLVFAAPGTFPLDHSGWNGALPDGRKAASGIYLYFTELLDQDGREEIVRGSVTLIR